MKKSLSLILALVLCLSLIPVTALAYGNNYIQLEKNNFDPNEEFNVTVSGIDSRWLENWAKVGVYQKGESSSGYGQDHQITQAPTESFRFGGIPESGEYEVRLYSNGYEFEVFTSVSITIGHVAQTGNITLDKTAYAAFAPITVTVTGITGQMVTAKAFVGVYKNGVLNRNYGFEYAESGSGTMTFTAPNENGEFEMRLYSVDGDYDNSFVMSVPFTVSGASNASGWAKEELEKANTFGLIPESLKNADFTKPITRAEFAAVSVKLYENLTGTKASPAAANPFTDTKDADVLKALNIGITNGTSADKFSPNVLLNREQAATMLLRVLKAAYIQGWTLATDGNFTLNFTQPAKFADDAKISDWAKPSVYFMAANGIISGTGSNMFSPRATTAAEEAANYASATREQALAIAVRMVENLKDKPLDYK